MAICSNGYMDKKSIVSMYNMPRKNSRTFIEQMFILFDRDQDGTIDFKVSHHIIIDIDPERAINPFLSIYHWNPPHFSDVYLVCHV